MQCPFCKETIQDGAIKCKHCHSMLTQTAVPSSPYRPQSPTASGTDDDPIQYFLNPLKNYVNFKGRSRRKEFWIFFAIYCVVGAALSALGKMGEILHAVWSLGMLLPMIAIQIRRMHDVGKSGWWILLPIVNLYFWAQPGTLGENQYGPDPLAG